MYFRVIMFGLRSFFNISFKKNIEPLFSFIDLFNYLLSWVEFDTKRLLFIFLIFLTLNSNFMVMIEITILNIILLILIILNKIKYN